MFRNFMAFALFGALVACAGGDDTGKDSTETSTDDGTDGTDDGTDGTDGAATDACWFGTTVCIEYSGDTETWCGGVGGDSNYVGYGGFGGGGGAQSHPGGGGGGYYGGGCGFNFPTDDTDTCNGNNNSTGGWSHNNGSNASGTDGANEGHGKVVIIKL